MHLSTSPFVSAAATCFAFTIFWQLVKVVEVNLFECAPAQTGVAKVMVIIATIAHLIFIGSPSGSSAAFAMVVNHAKLHHQKIRGKIIRDLAVKALSALLFARHPCDRKRR
jgi:hypothetical protein